MDMCWNARANEQFCKRFNCRIWIWTEKDLVVFDHQNSVCSGSFRCFINTVFRATCVYRIDNNMAYLLPLADNWATFVDWPWWLEDLFVQGNNVIKLYRNVSTSNNNLPLCCSKAIITNNTPAARFLFKPFLECCGSAGITDVDNDDFMTLTFTSFRIWCGFS